MKTYKLWSSLGVVSAFTARKTYLKVAECRGVHTSRHVDSNTSLGNWMERWYDGVTTRAPTFKVNGNKIKVLDTPKQFYDELLARSNKASHRITLASLYLGNGELEKKLVDQIHQNMASNGELKLNVLLDYTRGSRGANNSRTMLLPTLSRCLNRTRISLFHTPNLRGVLRKLIPERFNEVISVMHLKVYLFDDSLILSGANLSHDYFTNRHDRYIVFEDCADLCNYFDELVEVVSTFSFQLKPNDTVDLHTSFPFHPYQHPKEQYTKEVSNLLTAFTEKHASRECHSQLLSDVSRNDSAEDTLVIPFLQMKTFELVQDELITKNILSHAPLDWDVCLATAYFNVTDDYWNSILNSKARFDIVMAHPKAMGFYGAQGAAGHIPNAYNLIAQRRYQQAVDRRVTNRVHFKEYLRTGWTFHGKGLWAQFKIPNSPMLTLIGSPNFGKRSVYRDIEAQAMIVTLNTELKDKLSMERDVMLNHSTAVSKVTFAEDERSPSMLVYFTTRFLNDKF